jgi:LuxR family maltose regulon positive regulatory protein
VIDDVHELGSGEALRQLALFAMPAPRRLRVVLLTRRDLRLGLHCLRLDGELTEVRVDELRFSVQEARSLFDAAGTPLPDSALELLHTRTEGWAAGLRLAALSLAGRDDPERFAAEFSGTDRIVAEYLVDEVLDRLPDEFGKLSLRTSVLERVNGFLADLMTHSRLARGRNHPRKLAEGVCSPAQELSTLQSWSASTKPYAAAQHLRGSRRIGMRSGPAFGSPKFFSPLKW